MATYSGRIASSCVLIGRTVTFAKTVDGVRPVGAAPSLAAAKTGTLTTRTNGTTGTLTMTAGHGLTTGQKIDIYWGTGTSAGIAYNVTVGTVATNSVPIASAHGDALPAAATAVTVMVCHNEELVVATADLQVVAAYCAGSPMVARFVDGSNVDVGVALVRAGTDGFVWASGCNMGDNPLSDDAASVYLTHGVSTGARSPEVEVLLN